MYNPVLVDASGYITAIATVVLAVITWWYARITNKILDESQKMRRATEKQAEVASATLQHLQKQVEDLTDQGRWTVLTTIDSLIKSIHDWNKRNIKANFGAAGSFPSPNDLVPQHAQIALEHARRVSGGCVATLNDAFSDLRTARDRIDSLIAERKNGVFRSYIANAEDPTPLLETALEKLALAREEVAPAGKYI
jgi:hypothetical protein